VTIRLGTANDAGRAAELHTTSITEGFLPRLGARFLTRLYRCVVNDERSFLLVAEEPGGRVVGMIAGSEDVRGLYRRFLRRDGMIAAVVAAPRVLRNAGAVLETLRYGSSDANDLPSAELLSVAVDDSARGRGVGRQLVDALTAEFRRRGTASSKVVVGAANAPALRLYRACGYRDAATVEVHHNIPSQVLVWSSPAR
jgi:ribosomal protein S18 acetylase RimI-like enzyme